MPKLTINGQQIEVEEGTTLLQAAQMLGIEIPVFCYHPQLAVAGNCRMCLVDVEKSPKPVASCAMPAAEGMVVHTDTPKVIEDRKTILEFLLINHPLDCPICDQGGECDLQDITMLYGKDRGRFQENKRAVPDKNLGPLIKTAMNRCIHCTRCIRFSTEIAGVPELGGLGRGEHMEIGTYVEKALSSELSGNLIDICPVGALTAKPYSFEMRSWELEKTPSIDVMDGLGSAIRVDARQHQVMRILPRSHPEVNEEWISDKARFSADGLRYQRLDKPYLRQEEGWEIVSWEDAFKALQTQLHSVPPSQIGALTGDLCDAESLVVLKDLMASLGVLALDCRQDSGFVDPQWSGSFLFNTTLEGIEETHACLLIGTNPRWEAPLVNTRLRKRWSHLKGNFPVGMVGPSVDLTYPLLDLGQTPQALEDILKGRSSFSAILKKYQEEEKKTMLIIGTGALARPDGEGIFGLSYDIAQTYGMIQEGWSGFNVLHREAARVGALSLGLLPPQKQKGETPSSTGEILEACRQGKIKVLYLLGVDDIDFSGLENTFIIYQGHHGDRGAHHANLILPGAAYTEKQGTYMNIEGRVQRTYPSVCPPGQAKEDWKILRAAADVLGISLPYRTIEEVRQRLEEVNPCFKTEGAQPNVSSSWTQYSKKRTEDPFSLPITNFYMTNVISRHSPTMADCVRAFHSLKEKEVSL